MVGVAEGRTLYGSEGFMRPCLLLYTLLPLLLLLLLQRAVPGH
jgi:hypothetical protein